MCILKTGTKLIQSTALIISTSILISCGGGATDTTNIRSCNEGIYTYVVMNDGVTEDELYKTNGESDCTTMLQDMNKNRSSGTDDRLRWDFGNGTIMFIANDGVHDDELWRHNASGTALVKDHAIDGGMRPQSNAMVEGDDVLNSGLVLNGRLYYVISSPNGALRELWTTDGSESGTYMLHDADGVTQVIAYNGSVYFSSRTGSSTYSLWKTDGTVVGTSEFSATKTTYPAILNNKLYYIVDDTILTQTAGSPADITALGSIASGTVVSMVMVNNNLLMTVRTVTGSELYVSNGTATPGLLASLNAVSNSYVQLYRSFIAGAAVFFTVPDVDGILSLWKSDGTAPGTIEYGVINATNNPSVRFFTEFNSKTYFHANDGVNGGELWEIDGSAMSMIDLEAGFSSLAYSLTVFNNKLYFFAKNSTNGRQLWVHDGTQLQRVTDVFTPYSEYGLRELVVYNNSLYFTGMDSFGLELWKSDGSTAGTTRVTDLNPFGNSIYQFGSLHTFDGLLYFEASDGIHGRELWKSDGTAINTQMTLDINQQNIASQISSLFKFGNNDYVFAHDGAGQALWLIDDAGISMVKRLPGDARVNFTQEHNGFVYFNVEGSAGVDGIWRTDGTAINTTQVVDAATMNKISDLSVNGFASYNNELYFLAHHFVDGFGLYNLNTSNSSVTKVKTINPTGTSSRRFGILVELNKMLFMADDGVNGIEAWVSDGTQVGTEMLFDANTTPLQSSSSLLATTSTKIYFRGWNGTDNELWESDGVTANMLATDFIPLHGMDLNGSVYFAGLDRATNANGLYKYDGTGFSLLKELPSYVGDLIAYEGKLYFGNDDPANSVTHSALWVSDGTAAGTQILKSIFVTDAISGGGEESVPGGFADIVSSGDRIYFTFSDAASGKELWVSDGTAAGTKLVKDINPGPPDGTGLNPLSLIWDLY